MFNRRLLVNTKGGSVPVPPLPDKETYLVDGFGTGQVTFTIPEGCDVVKLYYDVYHEHEGFVQLDAQSNTGVWWCEAYPSGINVVLVQIYWLSNGNFIDFSYVGVTAGKTYNLKGWYTEYNNGEGEMYEVYNTSNYKNWFFAEYGTIDVDTGGAALRIVISWSPTINEQSPHYTDY